MWSDLMAGGAQEAAYIVYAMEDSVCFATSAQSSSGSAKFVGNVVAKFDTDQHAMAAYQSGAHRGRNTQCCWIAVGWPDRPADRAREQQLDYVGRRHSMGLLVDR